MPLEALHYPITPIGLHYLLIHFDIPVVDAGTWELAIGGHVERRLRLSLDNIKSRPQTTIAVTLECAGNGRARLSPRPMSQPWLSEAVGTAEWTGTPLGPILAEAGLRESARAVVFTGLDRGVQGGIDQLYERSIPLADAQRPEVMLVHAINGQPLPPQHGFPVRLIVPGWYGMTHVKWLRSITVTDAPFEGYQQARAYHYRVSDQGEGEAVTRMLPRALMVPPGVPDFISRTRWMRFRLPRTNIARELPYRPAPRPPRAGRRRSGRPPSGHAHAACRAALNGRTRHRRGGSRRATNRALHLSEDGTARPPCAGRMGRHTGSARLHPGVMWLSRSIRRDLCVGRGRVRCQHSGHRLPA